MADWSVTTLFKAKEQISEAFHKASGASKKFGDEAAGSIQKVQAAGSRLKEIMAGVTLGNLAARAITGGVNLVRNNIGAAIEYQSSLIETQNVVNQVFGASSRAVDAWASNNAKQFGLTELQAKKFSSTFASLLGGTGIEGALKKDMATRLAEVSGDLASFYNLSREDAFQKLMSGMRGQSEPLSALGVNMSVKSLEAFAQAKGIKTAWKDMDQLSQATLRFQFILGNPAVKNAMGDYGKPIASWAVSSQDAVSAIEQARGRLVEGLMPTLITAADYVKGLADRIGEWAVQNKAAITGFFEKAAEVARGVLTFITQFGPAIAGAAAAWKAAFAVHNARKALLGVHAALGLVTAATGTATTAQLALNAAMALCPVAIFAAVAGGLTLLIMKLDEAKKKTEAIAMKAAGVEATPENVKSFERHKAAIKRQAVRDAAGAGSLYSGQGLKSTEQINSEAAQAVARENQMDDLDARRLAARTKAAEMKKLDEVVDAVNGTTEAVKGLRERRGVPGRLNYSQMGIDDVWTIAARA
jgi:hypothetical protein